MNAKYLLAVDLGGTKVAAGLVDRQGRVLARREEPTCQDGPQPGIAQLAALVGEVMRETGVRVDEILGLGVGIPAVLEPDTDRVIWAPNIAGWRDVALRPTLAERLGLPVFVEYDGHAAVLGEWWLGAGRGYRSIAMIIAGTGIGGGLILDGHLYRGRDRLAGAAGWFALTEDAAHFDPRSQAIGHWESLAAGPGIARRALAELAQHPDSALADLPPDRLTARYVFDAARQGDALARRVIHETAELLGLGVANVVSLVNPEVVILGGSVGRQGDLLLPVVEQVVHRWAQPASAGSVVLRISELGPDAGLLGAARAVLDRSGISPEAMKE